MTALCPLDVHASIERRCAAARAGRLQPYSDMLRANVLDVVSSMFPRFSARRGKAELWQDVDDFVRNFGAVRAQFMHISTEFVRFSEGRLSDAIARALLEYEWVLFSVEVSEERVPAPRAGWAPGCLGEVRVNPTLQLLALPFDLDADAAESERMLAENFPPFVYAVYRTADHSVLTRSLTAVDINVFRELTDGVAQAGSDARSAWIADALQLGLVVARHN